MSEPATVPQTVYYSDETGAKLNVTRWSAWMERRRFGWRSEIIGNPSDLYVDIGWPPSVPASRPEYRLMIFRDGFEWEPPHVAVANRIYIPREQTVNATISMSLALGYELGEEEAGGDPIAFHSQA